MAAILIVEDDDNIRELLHYFFESISTVHNSRMFCVILYYVV